MCNETLREQGTYQIGLVLVVKVGGDTHPYPGVVFQA
jgi:hypothetical protein